VSLGGFRPGERVIVRLPLETNTRRTFVYTAWGEADRSGRVELTLSYPSEAVEGSAVRPTASAYVISEGRRRLMFAVSAKAVEEGSTLKL
jgi:hypothetical protein